MSTNPRKRILRSAKVFGVVFIALFLFRLLYGYFGISVNEGGYEEGNSFFNGLSNLRRNYASEKMDNSNNAGNKFLAGDFEFA